MAFSGAPALQEFGQRLGVANVQGVLSTVQWSRDVRVPGGFDLAFRYEREYDMYPSYDAAGGYAAGQVIEAAVRLAGTTDRAKVRDELAVLKFRSILGNYPRRPDRIADREVDVSGAVAGRPHQPGLSAERRALEAALSVSRLSAL